MTTKLPVKIRRRPEKNKKISRLFSLVRKAAYWLASMTVLGAIIHIGIVLLMPHMAPDNGWSRLAVISGFNQLVILPGARAKASPLSHMAPDIRYAICRYDLSKGPVQLKTPLPDELWSIALYTRDGRNFYLLSGRDVQAGQVNLLVVRDDNSGNKDNQDNSGNGKVKETTISSPVNQGIILIRAPFPSPAYEKRIVSQLKKAFCRAINFTSPGTNPRN